MQPEFSLAYLTVSSLSPPAAVETAAQLGYAQVGLRLLPATPGGAAQPLLDDPALLRETLARCRDTGVGVFDLEIVRIDEGFEPRRFLKLFEVGQQLGARAVLVAGDDRDPQRLAASYAALCETLQPFGMSADLEFMPWTAVPQLSGAVRVVEAAGRPRNAGVLIDALHFARSASRLDEVAALPREWLHYAQLCDAPAGIPATDAELIHAARCERLLPGEGGIDLRGLLDVLPRGLPLSVEIPNDKRMPVLGPVEWARQALAAARRVVAGAA